MRFVKMHGCGNSYIYMDVRGKSYTDEYLSSLAIRVSDKNTGIGSDGLIVLDTSTVADGRMRMFNMDGSEGAMCGNGIRCLAGFMYERAGIRKEHMTIETKSGIRELILEKRKPKEEGEENCDDNGEEIVRVTVNMGSPEFRTDRIPVLTDKPKFVEEPVTVHLAREEKTFTATCVSMGNPHCVTFIVGVDELSLQRIGPEFEHHFLFPDRINTEFVEIKDKNRARMRVWERGSGETMACGTGSCAAVAAGVKTGRLDTQVSVEMRGGVLDVTYDTEKNQIYMAGEVAFICEGTVPE